MPFHEAQSLSQNRDTARTRGFLLHFARPLPPAPHHPQALNNPPPPRRGRSRRQSICRVCSHTICRHRIDQSRLTRSRSFDYSKSACGSSALFRQAHRLSDTGRRGGLGGIIPQAVFSAFPRRAVLRLSSRPFDTGDGAMMPPAYQSAVGIDGGRAAAHVRGSFVFDAALFSFAYAVPSCLFVRPIRETERGLVCRPSSRCRR